jgi:ribosomal protein L21E
MATTFKEGDRVQIVDREATADDVKSGLFYNHFRGLTGTVQKVYATKEVAVEIEAESLAEAVAQRHLDVQEQMKSRWLDGLSEEGRNRLTDREKDFRLRYTLLVALQDITTPGMKAVPPAKQAAPAAHSTPAVSAARTVPGSAEVGEAAPRRATAADYEAAERAYLERRLREGKSEA